MSETHEGPGTVVVVAEAPREGQGEDSGDVGGAVEGEAVETIADASVEVARINAERDIEIARIDTEAGLEHHEMAVEQDAAMIAAMTEEEAREWQTRAEAAEAANIDLRRELERLTPPPSNTSPPNPSDQRTEAEEDGLRESPVVEAAVEEAQPPPEPPPKAHKSHRWI